MSDFENIFLSLDPNQNEAKLNDSIGSLNFLLKSSGATAHVVKSEEFGKVMLLHVACKVEDYSQKAKRHAGRPEIVAEKMTVGEAMDLRSTHTMEEIAKMAGISRRTLFRKIKKYKNMPDVTL